MGNPFYIWSKFLNKINYYNKRLRNMKNGLIIILFFLITGAIFSQKGIKIGYIDTEYILENLSEYSEVSERLEAQAQKWNSEIQKKKREILGMKEALNAERILLTKELIDEMEQEIFIEENDLEEFQQKKFGPNGDLIIQKTQLVQPIQDQIFNAIREIAKSKKYDFIFDKSSDLVMLYSDKRYNISDQVIQTISRSNNRKKLDSRKEKKEFDQQKNREIQKNNDESPKLNMREKNKENKIQEQGNSNRKLSVKELLEQRKQKNSTNKKGKD
jgi:Skp family chaperone for outer membrane proteins